MILHIATGIKKSNFNFAREKKEIFLTMAGKIHSEKCDENDRKKIPLFYAFLNNYCWIFPCQFKFFIISIIKITSKMSINFIRVARVDFLEMRDIRKCYLKTSKSGNPKPISLFHMQFHQ